MFRLMRLRFGCPLCSQTLHRGRRCHAHSPDPFLAFTGKSMREIWPRSSCFPKCEIVAYTPGLRMFSVSQRNDAVVTQSRRTSPDEYISMYDLDALSSFRALQPTEKERRGQP